MASYQSAHETLWAAELERLAASGRIASYAYEPRLFVLPKGKGYLPDFRVTLTCGQRVWCEVKGYLLPSYQFRKLRFVSRKYHFHVFVLVRPSGKTWRVTHVTPHCETSEDLYPERWLCRWVRDAHGRLYPSPHPEPTT